MALIFNESKNNSIKHLLNKHLGIEIHKLEIIFDQIYAQNKLAVHKPIVLNKNDVIINEFSDLHHFMLTGIDLPILLNNENDENSGSIMLVGSEPLRNWTYFENHKIDIYDKIVVNTPYSIHDIFDSDSVYFLIIDFLISKNQLYLTDLRKIWFSGFERHKKFLNSELHEKFFIDEVELIKPDRIITFGKNVFELLKSWLKSNNISLQIDYLIHPSQRTQGAGRKQFFQGLDINIDIYKHNLNSNYRNAQPYIDYLTKLL